MITARLLGGLGNQLFQYAAGRALSLRLGVPFQLDAREAWHNKPVFHPALHHFAIQTPEGSARTLPPDRKQPLRYTAWRYFARRPRLLRENGLGVNRAVLEAGDDTYLHGYFQSERYFLDQLETIRADLTITTPPSPENADWLGQLSQTPMATSLHVRRGDYVASTKGAAAHGSCDAAYYARALETVAKETGKTPQVFVFSDDPIWARDNLDLPFPKTVIGHNPPEAHYEDMRLMAACTHNIIANSTFSWWGGWLNPNPTKVVCAPKRWFADPTLHNPDILPDTWHPVSAT